MLQLFRLPNLFMVAMTQYLLQYLVLAPALQEAGIQPTLSVSHFSLLVLTTVLIAAGGYLINDILDYETDLINKPDRVIIEQNISKKSATILYYSIGLAGAVIAWYLATHVGNRFLFFIYPAAVLLLYFYSLYFKKIPLWGNLVVSVFCAGVAGIVLFSERETFALILGTQPLLANKISAVFSGYIWFAFVTTFLREIIKDMEDMEGDLQTGLNTYPISSGMESAKKLSIGISLFLLAGLVAGIYWLFKNHERFGVYFTLLFLIVPVFYIVHYLKKSEIKTHFTILSKLTKGVMLSGLLLLIILWKS